MNISMSNNFFDYQQTTHSISISVSAYFLEEESLPERNHYVWAYHIRIENLSQHTVQVLSRCWKITDAWSKVKIIKGEGVVGQQPLLEPGDSFEYTSTVPLKTFSGFMQGNYEMVQKETRLLFDVEIPTFSLDYPHHRYMVN
jgi:ApaG protein